MNEHGKNRVDLEQVDYRVRFREEWNRQFATLPKAERDMIEADPSGMLSEGLSIHVQKILSGGGCAKASRLPESD